MKKLFWRLTMMFWGLFSIVLLSFLITFYLNYEKSYSQKLLEIDNQVKEVVSIIDGNIKEYTRIVKLEQFRAVSILQENLEVFETMDSQEIERLLNEQSLNNWEDMTEAERLFYLAYLKTVEVVNGVLPHVKELYKDEHEIIDFMFIPFYDESMNQTIFAEKLNQSQHIELKDGLFILNESIKNQDQIWSAYEEVKWQGKVLGYLQLSFYTINPKNIVPDTGLNGGLYYVDNQLYTENNLSPKLNERLSTASFEEASYILKDEGYYLSQHTSEVIDLKIIHYQSKDQLRSAVIAQMISLFELSTILLNILFLLVSYILFMSIVKPCYLLIDYVKRCGEGNYTIPSNLSHIWRSSFLMVRNAYLENERLLNVKGSQSQELEYAWKRALVASQAKTHFLAKVSHELKTPLNAIKGYVQLLKLSIDHPKQRKQLDIIEHSSDLLLKQVNELLDFSMIEDGKVKLSIEQIDIFQTAHKVEELFVIDAANKGIELKVTIDESIPPELYGDEDRIKQIIINLVSNAIKFTDIGEIKVSFDLDYQNETEAYLSIKVNDTGKGIAPNKLESIFEAFTQENNTISRRYGGTGLGLSISKRLADVMGGNLTVESTLEVGSTFTLFLPLAKTLVEEDEC